MKDYPLLPSTLREVADDLRRITHEAKVHLESVGMRLDLDMSRYVDMSRYAPADWSRFLQAVHAGSVASLGSGASAVRAVVEAACTEVPGNESLRDWLARLDALTTEAAPGVAEIEDCLARARMTLEAMTLLRPRPPMPSWLDRPELGILLASIGQASKPVVLLGGPGSGKSNLLGRLASELDERGTPVLAIRAERLEQGIDTLEKLGPWLGLSESPVRILEVLGSQRPTVLIIDQLDALCDLMDARTRRLDMLLQLVRAARRMEGVAVVLSSREFEMRHDTRFRDLDAQEVDLAPLDLNVVRGVLIQRGVDPNAAGPAMLEMLRTPQHLQIFLSLLTDGKPAPTFDTYERMLGHLWQQRVIGTDGDPGRERVLLDIVSRMAEHEELHVPRALFERDVAAVDRLVALDILRVPDPRRIELSHQSWFSYIRARTFVTGQEHLTDFVRSKGGSLFVRATLWSALVNLRAADRRRYHAELRALLEMEDLRAHLRMLVVEHIGHAGDPTDVEAELLLPFLHRKGSFRGIALGAIVGQAGWFERLAGRHLPVLMEREDASEIYSVLASAWPLARERTLALLEKHWIHQAERAAWGLAVLSRLTVWDERAVDLLIAALRTAPQNRGGLAGNSMLFHVVAEHAPSLAPRLARVMLDQAIANADPPTSAYRTVDWVVRGHHDLHGFTDLAQKAPEAVLDHIWPWFVGALMLSLEDRGAGIGYPRALTSHVVWRDESQPPDDLFEGLKSALIVLGRKDPEVLAAFVHKWSSTEEELTHELLAFGLTEIAARLPSAAVDYLLGDSRRLLVGDPSNPTGATLALLGAVAPHATATQVRHLEEAVARSARYRTDPESGEPEHRYRRRRYNRAHRMALLQALARSEHLSVEARRTLEHERVALADVKEERFHFGGLQQIKSRMSAEQMARASVADTVRLLHQLPDSTGWRHPRRSMVGGAVEASREVAKLAKSMPGKALEVISYLVPDQNEMPVGMVLQEIASSGTLHTAAEVERIVLAYESKGFSSEDFRDGVAWGLIKLAERSDGLSDEVCRMLEGWLERSTAASTAGTSDQEEERDQKTSVLWGRGGMMVLPGGNFPILQALLAGHACRKPPALEAWLAILEAHVDRGDRPAVWRALIRRLPFLCDRKEMQQAANDLFCNVPGVLCSTEGVILAAHLFWHVNEERIRSWMGILRESDWRTAAQARGELVGVLCVNRPEISWGRAEVEAILASDDSSPQAVDAKRGLAFAAANMWWWPSGREVCTDALIALARSESASVRAAAMEVFHHQEVMPADEHTERLLDALGESPQALRDANAPSVVWHLSRLCAEEPERTLRLCEILVSMDEAAMRASRIDVGADDLINVSLTLQRKESFREAGLSLFERLLELNLYGIYKVLREVDIRTVMLDPTGHEAWGRRRSDTAHE